MAPPRPISSAATVTFNDFHYFPKLPIELRLKIWALTIEPRIIKTVFGEDGRIHTHKYICNIPSLLHVNSESRVEGLRFYELSKQNTKTKGKFVRNAINKFYFHPDVDTLCISHRTSWTQWRLFLEKNECGLLKKVQKMAIPRRVFETPYSMMYLYSHALVEVVIPIPFRCDPNCSCTTLAFRDFEDVKAEEGMQGHRTYWGDVRKTEKEMQELEGDFERMWKQVGEATCPAVKVVLVCGNFGAYVSAQEIGHFRTALKASASGAI